MKFHFTRKKQRNLLVSVINRFFKLPIIGGHTKLKLFLNINWIFWRLSLEQADKVYGFTDDSMRRKNLNFLLHKIKNNHTIMDLGCKFGRISSILAENSYSVIGVDHDENAIKIAIKNNTKTNLKFINADALDYLNTNSTKFDVLVLSHILEHLDHPLEFLNKFKNHFNSFYIEIPDIDDSYLNHYRKRENLELLYTDHDHIWEFDRDSFTELLKQCDMKIIDSEYRYGLQKYWCIKKT